MSLCAITDGPQGVEDRTLVTFDRRPGLFEPRHYINADRHFGDFPDPCNGFGQAAIEGFVVESVDVEHLRQVYERAHPRG